MERKRDELNKRLAEEKKKREIEKKLDEHNKRVLNNHLKKGHRLGCLLVLIIYSFEIFIVYCCSLKCQ